MRSQISNRAEPDCAIGLTWGALCCAYQEHRRQALLLASYRRPMLKARRSLFLATAAAYLVGLVSGVLAFWLIWSLSP